MFAILATYAALDVRGVGAVLEVVAAGCRQGGLKGCRLLSVHPGHTPDLVRCQVKVAKNARERLARIDRIHKSLAHLRR